MYYLVLKEEERGFILGALTEFRDGILKSGEHLGFADAADAALLRLCKAHKKKVKVMGENGEITKQFRVLAALERNERGVIIHALDKKRNQLNEARQSSESCNRLIKAAFDAPECRSELFGKEYHAQAR